MNNANGIEGLVTLAFIALVVIALYYRAPWRPSTTAYGTGRWGTRSDLKRAGMIGGPSGLILGRSLDDGQVVRAPRYTMACCVAPTGAGKGVSAVIPTLLSYFKGAVFVLDHKMDNYSATAAFRAARGENIVLLDPFGITGRSDASTLNLLDLVEDGPPLFDQAQALADAMIPKTGMEPDPHWVECATAVLAGLIVFTKLQLVEDERNLNSVCEMAANVHLFDEATTKLLAMGGNAARMGGPMASLADKEKASVLTTVNRALACFTSDPMTRFLAKTTFDANALLKPGTTIYYGLPVQYLDSHKGLLRAVVSSLLLQVMKHGDERKAETLYVLDECATLGNLDALAQGLVLGRGKGIRLFTLWQTVEQARAAFPQKPNLVLDNSDVQLVWSVNGLETAQRVSQMLGNATLTTATSASEGYSRSWQQGGMQQNGVNVSYSDNRSYQTHARALLDPAEVMRLSSETVLVFIRDVPPLMLRRIKYYTDPLFVAPPPLPLLWWAILAAATGLTVWWAVAR